MPTDQYTHGHHASVVGAHAARTIANSAGYLTPHLSTGKTLLDVGCGPGTITAEFAQRLGAGNVVGFDLADAVVQHAADAFGHSGASFKVDDVYSIDEPNDRWDIVHAHQVLQHLSDPVAALKEMRRVAKPGGVVAVRDADYSAMHWAPDSPALQRWLEIYLEVARANQAEPDAGRYLLGWAQQAGFGEIRPSVGTWLYADQPSRDWWAGVWAERILESAMASQAIEADISTRDELKELSSRWLEWAAKDDGWFVIVHAELICTVP